MDLVFNNFTTNKSYDVIFFKNILAKAEPIAKIGFTKLELSINLVSEQKIKTLNKKHRNKNTITDVLSFPLHDKITTKSIEGGILSLGDIFICPSVAKKWAARDNVSLDYELTFLTVHGFLHLLGYDHEKSATEENKMFSLQNKILKYLGFSIERLE